MHITDMKQLNTEQYEACRQTALERVKRRVGTRPKRADFQRELGPLWTILDLLALVVFVAAFVISSLHIMEYVSSAVSDKGDGWYITVNQLGYIFLAEAAMVLFMVMHGMTANRRRERPALLRPVSVHLLLAITAAVFIFTANLSTGIGVLLSLMPPLFTVGIAFNLERLIISSLKRREQINERYMQAIADYEAATVDPEQHSKYQEFFAQALWDKLISLKSNRQFVDAPNGFRVAAIRREMERENWMSAVPVDTYESDETEPPSGVPFGNFPHDQVDHESTLTTVHANGHGGHVTVQN